ncbi:MAG: efflux RND transporter periplasmic adaptor subunit [Synergistaceae bacterium]|jgi:HlyD family secretion protein|nr:efflux RND transporter periplasmic adaptor subunit [Synergistaceae bacterium]
MKTIKRFFRILLIAALVGGGSWYAFFRTQPVRYVYRTQPVTKGSVTATVSATGRLNSVGMVEVGTQVSGTIQAIYVDYNSPVRKGQLIALLDPDVLKSQVEQVKASLALAQAGVTSARASVADKKRAWERNKELWARNLIAKSDLDSAETALTLARATLTESEARVVQAKASLQQAETNLDYAKIVSPVDGVVISRKVDVGQTVAASLQTPTLFSIARDLTQMQVEASIDEADIGRIAEGQKAECKFDAWPKQTFEGTVTQVRLHPEVVSNIVTYTVVLSVANADMKLKPGMTANVTIVTDRRDDVLKIPAAALRFSPPPDAVPAERTETEAAASSPLGMPRFLHGSSQSRSEQVVWLVENGRLVGSVPLGEQGLSDRTWVEIVNSPLKEGQELAVSFSKETGESGAALAGTKR